MDYLTSSTAAAWYLTEAGSSFYERAVHILADVEEARTATTSLNQRQQGLLRINVPGNSKALLTAAVTVSTWLCCRPIQDEYD
jgi:DNA-binding transcriptional LysR family regulator